jgi:23S rRNA (adenine1618-N6)-methyltransferase
MQANPADMFYSILKKDEFIDIVVCNPPFHASLAEAQEGTERKWRNLGIKNNGESNLNFGGQNAELWCEGGEYVFIQKMIEESVLWSKNCFWFTTLVSKKTTLPGIYTALKKVNALDVRTIEMAQGQKVSRMVAWTFVKQPLAKR